MSLLTKAENFLAITLSKSVKGYEMHIFEYLVLNCQPNYKKSVINILIELSKTLDLNDFNDVDLEFLPGLIIDQIREAPIESLTKVHLLKGLLNLDWWTDINLSDQNKNELSKIARKELFQIASRLKNLSLKSEHNIKVRHAVFVGQISHLLHSPTRGAIDYIRALMTHPETIKIDVFYTGSFTPEIKAYADGILKNNTNISYTNIDMEPDWLESAIINGPYTYHFWCEPHLSVQIGIMALFGPSIMFTTGHIAPIQYADVYWYSHDVEYIEALWKRTGAPDYFIGNYRFLRSAPIFIPQPSQKRSRADIGLRMDEIVLTSVGNRLGAEITEEFIDGLCPIILKNPKVRWLAIGPLQDYWIDTFNSVLGDQFIHIPYDQDLPSLMQNVDIFVNSFRAGGGMSAAIAIDAGAVFLGRGDFGDTMSLVPHAHRQNSVDDYFEKLQELIDSSELRGSWSDEQKSYLSIYADPDNFQQELNQLIEIAHDRYEKRKPIDIIKLYDQ